MEPNWNAIARASLDKWDAVAACSSSLRAAYALGKRDIQKWLPIADAPRDEHLPYDERPIWLLYVAERDGLHAFQTTCRYHDDAGWCVDELREATHYQHLPPPPENTP